MALVIVVCLGAASLLQAQQPPVHYWHRGIMPPGAIGSRQLQRGGPLPGYFQPVDIKAPEGVLISLAVDGNFAQPQKAPLKAGMLIGQVYRLRVMNIPHREGMEIFPTIEVIDRLYPPAGQELRFAIPVQLTREEIEMALAGKFVTRVIYLEDPDYALPTSEGPQGQSWYQVGPGSDPLAMADSLGRPVAILRLGGRLPADTRVPDPRFLFGCPPLVDYSLSVDKSQAQAPLPAPPDVAPKEPRP